MPRANRLSLPQHVWHITHRCHKKEFLLKFARDRMRWRHWLFEARKRYGLCVLNYIVTSNHVHLLVRDKGEGEVAHGMQLIAGRTAQEFNRRKQRKGAFWEDRYHATAVDAGSHLARCMVYIDLNMVRAGVVTHPAHWPVSGYLEIQQPPKRYRIIDLPALLQLLDIGELATLQRTQASRVEESLARGVLVREGKWSESMAVGREAFVDRLKNDSGASFRYRKILEDGDGYCLRDTMAAYNLDSGAKMDALSGNERVIHVK